ncbi:MAG: hypothetical protein WCJ81_08420 [bacterium]
MTLVKKAMGRRDFVDVLYLKAWKTDPADNDHVAAVKEELYTLLIYSNNKIQVQAPLHHDTTIPNIYKLPDTKLENQSPIEDEDVFSKDDVFIAPNQAAVKIAGKNASYCINLSSNRCFEDAEQLYKRMFPPSFMQSVLKNLSAILAPIIS